MLTALAIAIALAQRPVVSDAQLRKACVNLFHHVGEDNRMPKAWKTIATIPDRITRLKKLLHQKPTASEFAGISYALGISGYNPVAMQKNLLGFVCGTVEVPTDNGENVGENVSGAIDSLYRHFPTDDMLALVASCGGDGTAAAMTHMFAKEILDERGRHLLRVAHKQHLEDAIGNNLCTECDDKDAADIDRNLRKLSRDSDPIIRKTATTIAHIFIKGYNENYGGDPGQPKLKDWTRTPSAPVEKDHKNSRTHRAAR